MHSSLRQVMIALAGLAALVLLFTFAHGNEAPACEPIATVVQNARAMPNVNIMKIESEGLQKLQADGADLVEGTASVYMFNIDNAQVLFVEVDAKGCIIPGHIHQVPVGIWERVIEVLGGKGGQGA